MESGAGSEVEGLLFADIKSTRNADFMKKKIWQGVQRIAKARHNGLIKASAEDSCAKWDEVKIKRGIDSVGCGQCSVELQIGGFEKSFKLDKKALQRVVQAAGIDRPPRICEEVFNQLTNRWDTILLEQRRKDIDIGTAVNDALTAAKTSVFKSKYDATIYEYQLHLSAAVADGLHPLLEDTRWQFGVSDQGITAEMISPPSGQPALIAGWNDLLTGENLDCLEKDTKYLEENGALDMAGLQKQAAWSIGDCQRRCRQIPGCVHFSYWDDGGCHFESENAQRVDEPPGWILGGSTAGPPECPIRSCRDTSNDQKQQKCQETQAFARGLAKLFDASAFEQFPDNLYCWDKGDMIQSYNGQKLDGILVSMALCKATELQVCKLPVEIRAISPKVIEEQTANCKGELITVSLEKPSDMFDCKVKWGGNVDYVCQ